MQNPGKYDSAVADALRLREPVARVMRRAGFSEKEIRSCQGMLAEIRSRIAPEDETAWSHRKRLLLLTKRRQAIERLERSTRENEARDLQLLETCDRMLAQMKKKEGVASYPSQERIDIDVMSIA